MECSIWFATWDYVEYESESTATKFHQFSQKLLVNNENFSEKENIESFNQLTMKKMKLLESNSFKNINS